jgi:hypothetical protein
MKSKTEPFINQYEINIEIVPVDKKARLIEIRQEVLVEQKDEVLRKAREEEHACACCIDPLLTDLDYFI